MSQNVMFQQGGPKRPGGIKYDSGFGKPKRLPTVEELLKYDAIKDVVNHGTSVGRILDAVDPLNIVPDMMKNPMLDRFLSLPDAIAALRHFLNASGADRKVRYEAFLADDPAGRLLKVNVRFLVRQSVERIFAEHYQARVGAGGAASFLVTSSVIAMNEEDGGDFLYPTTENWQKTLGAHFVWASGRINVTFARKVSSAPIFYMELTLHAEDLYNFNPGQEDIASKTSDAMFGVFEENGLAKAYMNYGESTFSERWIGRTVNVAQVQYNYPGAW